MRRAAMMSLRFRDEPMRLFIFHTPPSAADAPRAADAAPPMMSL